MYEKSMAKCLGLERAARTYSNQSRISTSKAWFELWEWCNVMYLGTIARYALSTNIKGVELGNFMVALY